jgi:hypothetical protein
MKIRTKPEVMNKWEQSRRDLLKGLGVGLGCLPLLSAGMARGQTAAAKKFFCHLQTEGYRMMNWLPPQGPLPATLPSSLQPLAEFKDHLIVLGNLGNAAFPGCVRWGHGAYGGIFTGGTVDPNSGNGKEYWEPLQPSIDQQIATQFAKETPMLQRKSLPFEIGTGATGRYPGSNRCYWTGNKQPVTPESDPYKVFSQIFTGMPMTSPGTPVADPAADRLRLERKSLLDFVGADLERFKLRLGAEDRMSVDGHLTSIRDLERQLTSGPVASANCGNPMWSGNAAMPVAITTANTPMLWTLQMQLIVAALKCGITRVGTTQVGDATGGRIIFDFVPGVPRQGNGYQPNRDWHDLGHRPVRAGVADGDDKSKVDKWTMGKFAELLTLLKNTPDTTGTLLDNTVVLWGNHMEDGASHGAVKIPWIIAGKGQGYFKTGQGIPNPAREINGPMFEICRAMGIQQEFYNNANTGKPMPELRAGA